MTGAHRLRYHSAMDDFDKRWQRIHEQLVYQLRGDERPRVSSQRTLFGIKSEVEMKMERFAAEIEEERRARVAAKRAENDHAETNGTNGATKGEDH